MAEEPLSERVNRKKRAEAGHQSIPRKVWANRSPILDINKHIAAYQVDLLEMARTDDQPPRKASGAGLCAFLERSNPRSLSGGRMAFVRGDTHALAQLSGRTDWKGTLVFDFDLSTPEGKDIAGLLRSLDGEKAGFSFCLSNASPMLGLSASDPPCGCPGGKSPRPASKVPGLPPHLGSLGLETIKPLLSSGCFVKIDVAHRKKGELEAIVPAFRNLPVRMVAKSVDTWEDFAVCSRLGFELFHGAFFRKPSALARSSVSPNHALLLDLSTRAAHDEDIQNIEEIFKKNPDLTFGLFNLVRSAYFHVSKDVTSIKQAITMLGYKNLQKWAALMLFTINHSDPSSNPLFENVLVRAATMELAASKLRRKGLGDAAYMTGILSLVPALFDVPMEEMVAKANFGEEIREALLRGAGPLGAMLAVVEGLEQGDYEKCGERTGEVDIGLESFLSAQATAFADCCALTHSQDGDKPVKEGPSRQPGQKSPQSSKIHCGPSPQPSWLKKVRSFFHLR